MIAIQEESKYWDTVCVLSITTGRLLTSFSNMHECIEWVAGHSVWTHELADKQLFSSLRKTIYGQHPQLTEVDSSNINRDNWEEFAKKVEKKFGNRLSLVKGHAKRKQNPIETLKEVVPNTPVIQVKR